MDTHADMACAGSNWWVMELMGIECKVSPFLDSYKPMNNVPVARCGMVWTDKTLGQDYLLVADQMLFFGTTLQHSLINPNQVRAYGIDVNDNPFNTDTPLGIDCNEVFIPLDTRGMVVHFESWVPMDDELKHLPVILLMADEWDPSDEMMYPHKQTREYMEMHMVWSLTSGMTR